MVIFSFIDIRLHSRILFLMISQIDNDPFN